MSAARSNAATSTRPEDERLPPGRTIAYGFQHVLTMYGGIIAPPLVMGGAAGMDTAEIGVLVASCLFIGGLATILQTLGIPFFGAQLPLVQGTSFSGVATMIAILNGGGGMPAVFGAVLAAGAIGIVIAPFFAKLLRFFRRWSPAWSSPSSACRCSRSPPTGPWAAPPRARTTGR